MIKSPLRQSYLKPCVRRDVSCRQPSPCLSGGCAAFIRAGHPICVAGDGVAKRAAVRGRECCSACPQR